MSARRPRQPRALAMAGMADARSCRCERVARADAYARSSMIISYRCFGWRQSAAHSASTPSRPDRCSYAASRVRLTFLVLLGGPAWAAGLRTRQGRAARAEGKLLLGHVCSAGRLGRGRPTNRSKASTDAAAEYWVRPSPGHLG